MRRYTEVLEDEMMRKRLAGEALCWLCWPTPRPLILHHGVRICVECDREVLDDVAR